MKVMMNVYETTALKRSHKSWCKLISDTELYENYDECV